MMILKSKGVVMFDFAGKQKIHPIFIKNNFMNLPQKHFA